MKEIPSPRRVYGVDFSGARDANRKIWIAIGQVNGTLLEIERCQPLKELCLSGKDREDWFSELVTFIGEDENSIFGMDFPFGLPAALVEQDTWEKFILSFRTRFSDAQRFREICFERRETDVS